MKTTTIKYILETLSSKVSSNSIEAYKLLSLIMITDPNPVHVSELVLMNKTGAVRTGKLLDKLKDDRLIQINVSEWDARKREVTLTNEGRKFKEELENDNHKVED